MNQHGIERQEWERRFLASIAARAVGGDDKPLDAATAAELGAEELAAWGPECKDWPHTLPEDAADEQMSNWLDHEGP